MSDIDFHGKNKISGYSIKMKVRNVEHFCPEVQQAFKDLIKATEYPKQSTIEEWEGTE